MTVPPTGADGVLPGTPREWLIAIGRISGLMLVLIGADSAGEELPTPLGRPAGRAWGRVTRALRDASPQRIVDAEDLDLLRLAARVLGRELCRHRTYGVESAVVSALLAEAAVHDTQAEQLVAQLARVHGVLEAAGRGVRADDVWRAAG